MQNLKKRNELEAMLNSKLGAKYSKLSSTPAAARAVIKSKIAEFVKQGNLSSLDVRELEKNIQKALRQLKEEAKATSRPPRAAAPVPAAKPTAPTRPRPSTAASRESKQSIDTAKAMAGSMVGSVTEGRIVGSWSDVNIALPGRASPKKHDLKSEEWALMIHYDDYRRAQQEQQKQRAERESAEKVRQELKRQMEEAERQRKKAKADEYAYRMQLEKEDNEWNAEQARIAQERKRQAAADLAERDRQLELSKKRRAAEAKARRQYEEEVLQAAKAEVENDQQRRLREKQRMRESMLDAHRENLQEQARRDAIRRKERDEDTRRMEEYAASVEAAERKRENEHKARVAKLEAIQQRQARTFKGMADKLAADDMRTEMEAQASYEAAQERKRREQQARDDALREQRRILKQQMAEKERQRQAEREESKRELQRIMREAKEHEAEERAKMTRRREAAVANRLELERQAVAHAHRGASGDVASMAMTDLERKLNAKLVADALDTLKAGQLAATLPPKKLA